MNHYAIYTEKKKPETAEEKIALTTYMGNIIAKVFCCGSVCDEYITPLDNTFFEAAKMPNGLGKDFYENLMRDLDMYKKFLNIQDDREDLGKEKKEIGIFSPSRDVFVLPEAYFKAQGHAVTRIPKSASYREYDQKFDIICIWSGTKTTIESIKPLTSIIRRTNEQIDATKGPPLTPLLALVHKDTPLAAHTHDLLSLMYNECDLRQLDENLFQILDGKKITLPRIDTVSHTGAASDQPVETDNGTTDSKPVNKDRGMEKEKSVEGVAEKKNA